MTNIPPLKTFPHAIASSGSRLENQLILRRFHRNQRLLCIIERKLAKLY